MGGVGVGPNPPKERRIDETCARDGEGINTRRVIRVPGIDGRPVQDLTDIIDNRRVLSTIAEGEEARPAPGMLEARMSRPRQVRTWKRQKGAWALVERGQGVPEGDFAAQGTEIMSPSHLR